MAEPMLMNENIGSDWASDRQLAYLLRQQKMQAAAEERQAALARADKTTEAVIKAGAMMTGAGKVAVKVADIFKKTANHSGVIKVLLWLLVIMSAAIIALIVLSLMSFLVGVLAAPVEFIGQVL